MVCVLMPFLARAETQDRHGILFRFIQGNNFSLNVLSYSGTPRLCLTLDYHPMWVGTSCSNGVDKQDKESPDRHPGIPLTSKTPQSQSQARLLSDKLWNRCWATVSVLPIEDNLQSAVVLCFLRGRIVRLGSLIPAQSRC